MRYIWVLEQINNGMNENSYFSSKDKAFNFIDSMIDKNWNYKETSKNFFHLSNAKNNNVTFLYLYKREVF